MAYDYEADTVADNCERQLGENVLTSIETAIPYLRQAEEHGMQTLKSMCYRYLYEAGSELQQYEEWKMLAVDYPGLIAEMIIDWDFYRERK